MPLSVQEYLSKRQDKAAGSSPLPGKPPERISDEEMQSLSSAEANTGPALDSPFAMNQMVSHGEQRIKDPGFFSKLASGAGNLAKEAYKGVARPLFTPVAGLISGITGEDVELPEWAGSAKGSVDLDKQARIAGGAALESAALLPAGKAVQALKGAKGGSSLLKLSLAEAKLGAKSGFASAAGSTLGTDENATAADVVGSGIAGGLIGGAIGGVAPAISKGWSKVRGNFADDAERAFQAGKPKTADVLPGEMPKVEAPKSLHEFDEDLFPAQSPEAKVLPEKAKKRALDLGFKEHQINNIEQASNAERAMIKEMADIAEAKSKNVLYPKDPTEVAARPIIDQVKHLKDMRTTAGKSLDELVAQMPDKPIPITEQRNALHGWFESNGVKVDPEGNLDFSKSKYRSSASAGDRAILQELADEFKPTTLDNFAPGQIHKTPEEIRVLRQALREVQESKAKSGQPLSSSIETLIGSLRQELNAPLAKLSPAYEAANKNYAVTSDALTKFYKFLGKRFYDSEDELANMRVQELLGRLVSNVPANTKAVLDDVAQAAGKTGMQIDPNVDVRRLLHADEMISDIYGLAAPRGFQGGIERGVKNAAEGLGTATDIAAAAAGSPGGLVQRGLSFFGKITPEKRKAALLEMLGNAEVPKGEAVTDPLAKIGDAGIFDNGLAPLVSAKAKSLNLNVPKLSADVDGLMTKAPQAKKEIDDLTRSIADKNGLKISFGPLKKKERAMDKIIMDYDGDHTKIGDVVRNTLVGDDSVAVSKALKELQSTPGHKRTKFQKSADFGGYSGIIVNVESPSGVISEIQLNSPEMIFAKESPQNAKQVLGEDVWESVKQRTGLEGGKGHKFLEEIRDLMNNKADKSEIDLVKQKMKDYYQQFKGLDLDKM